MALDILSPVFIAFQTAEKTRRFLSLKQVQRVIPDADSPNMSLARDIMLPIRKLEKTTVLAVSLRPFLYREAHHGAR